MKDDRGRRFELLEIDDDHVQSVGQREAIESETDRRRREAEIAHAEALAQRERDLAEATARRQASALARAEQRRGRAKARYKKHSAKKLVNDELHELGLKRWNSVTEATAAAFSAVEKGGFMDTGEISHESDINGNHHVVYVVENEEGDQHGLSVSTYRYSSGRYELTSYLS